jgi:hypothetical protein
MGRYATRGAGGDYEEPPISTHVARIVHIIDLGTQESEYQGVTAQRPKIAVGFELPDVLMSQGKSAGEPFLKWKFYTNSLDERSNLAQDLVRLGFGDELPSKEDPDEGVFDLEELLGVGCMVSIEKKASAGTKVGAVMALPAGYPVKPAFYSTWCFWLDDFTEDNFDLVPKGFRAIIQKSPEYLVAIGQVPPEQPGAGGDDFRDIDFGGSDIPF